MKTKKIICIIITVVLICTTAACGPGSSNGDGAPPPPSGEGTNTGAGSGGSGGSAASPGVTTSPTTSPTISPDTDRNTAEESPSPSESPDSDDNGDSPDSGDAGNSAEPSPPDPSPETSPEAGGSGDSGAGLTGAPEDILAKFVDDLRNAGAEMPMSMPPSAVSAEESQYAIGLSEADFQQYVAAAAQSIAAIGTFAHQIVIYQGVDANAAGQIKRLVSESGGYDPQKWICVFPETVVVVDSGPYVLLVASYREVAEIALEVFEATAGSTGETITFWSGV